MQTRSVFFVTGTDTGVGKTRISCALLRKAQQLGLSTAAVKPLAAGAEMTADGLRNEDALALQQCCSLPLAYTRINPVCFEPAIAPHIAAAENGVEIDLTTLLKACRDVIRMEAALTLIEGAGGWFVPLNRSRTLADLPEQLGIPVILVVGLRLGCISHALLTAAAIRESGVPLAGWVANQVDPDMQHAEANIQTLKDFIDAPLLAIVPWLEHDGGDVDFIDEQAIRLLTA